jgi:ABC-type Fe3+-hydroxamate transport system substrate-binding protein
MNKLFILLPLVALSLAGCTKVDSTEVTPAEFTARGAAANARKESKRTVSVKGTFKTLVTPLSTAPGGLVVNGTGQVSHFGNSTFVDYPVVNFATLSGTGMYTLTAANGDQLTGTTIIALEVLTPTTFQVIIHVTITGGTGRFAGATGDIYGRDVLDQNNPAGTLTIVGEITY